MKESAKKICRNCEYYQLDNIDGAGMGFCYRNHEPKLDVESCHLFDNGDTLLRRIIKSIINNL